MEFLPIKPTILNAIVWFSVVLLFIGISKGIGGAGANYFLGGIIIGCPVYFASIIKLEGFDLHH
ncbi:MAG: hypothetical protein ACQEQS_11585 [Thermodesulfobacteriota bacterium]